MKRFIFAALAFALIAAAPAFAAQKSTAALQTDLLTYKTRSFNAEANYSNLLNLSDSMFNKTTDDFRDITGLSGIADAELGYIDITTLGTAAASKALTFDASLDAIIPTGGLVTFQSGGQITMASGSTLAVSGTFTGVDLALTGHFTAGEGTRDKIGSDAGNAYITGLLEVDGATYLDGNLTVASNKSIEMGGVSGATYVGGGGNSTLSGFVQTRSFSSTTSLTSAFCGVTYVSNSADVTTLPEASTVIGCRIAFVCGTVDDFDINPADATDAIGVVASITGANTTTVLAPAAGDAIRCTDIGSSIILEAVGADLWASIGTANGVWTDVN